MARKRDVISETTSNDPLPHPMLGTLVKDSRARKRKPAAPPAKTEITLCCTWCRHQGPPADFQNPDASGFSHTMAFRGALESPALPSAVEPGESLRLDAADILCRYCAKNELPPLEWRRQDLTISQT